GLRAGPGDRLRGRRMRDRKPCNRGKHHTVLESHESPLSANNTIFVCILQTSLRSLQIAYRSIEATCDSTFAVALQWISPQPLMWEACADRFRLCREPPDMALELARKLRVGPFARLRAHILGLHDLVNEVALSVSQILDRHRLGRHRLSAGR